MIRPAPLRIVALGAVAALAGAGALAVLDGDADARRKPRKPRRPHRFLSQKAPARSRAPATDAAGAPSFADRPVAEGAADGQSRLQNTAAGAALVLSPTRALLANPYRGFVVVDTTDPADPQVVGRAALDGSPRRLFETGGRALVLSDLWKDGVATTQAAVVDFSDESAPTVLGTVEVEGSLLDATHAADGGVLLLTADGGWWGPWVGVTDTTEGGGVRGGPSNSDGALPGAPEGATGDAIVAPWWGGSGATRVATVAVADDGTPSLGGVVEVEGLRQGHAFDADTAVIAIQRGGWSVRPATEDDPGTERKAPADDPSGANVPDGTLDTTDPWTYEEPTSHLVVVQSPAGVPAIAGETQMHGVLYPQTLDLAGPTLRLLGYDVAGEWALTTWSIGDGAPEALGSLVLGGTWNATAFSGDRFAWTTYEWTWNGEEVPPDPDPVPGDPSDGGVFRTANTGDGTTAKVVSELRVADLSDPAAPKLGGKLDLGDGWSAGLRAVPDGVLVSVATNDALRALRVDLTDAADPTATATADLEGSWWMDRTAGDLVLFQGYRQDGSSWTYLTTPFDVSGGGLVEGGAFPSSGWVADAAYAEPILGLAAPEHLTLVDLSDFANPVVSGRLRLAINVTDVEALSDTAGAALVVDWSSGESEVRTFALETADALDPLDAIAVGRGDARMFRNGGFLYLLRTDWTTGGSRLTVIDANDPADLRERGSLDLASYPGQTFLVGDALVLLREAWSLVAKDGTSGRRGDVTSADDGSAPPDAFGRCPNRWLRDELTAAIDVIDLSDPDAPRAASRTRVRWDWSGPAILSGRTLYVPSYVERPYLTPWGPEVFYVYGVRTIDLSDVLAPQVGPLSAVPGSLVAAADGKGRVLTVQYRWDDPDGASFPTLHLVDLAARGDARVVAGADLDGWPGAVIVADGHVHATTEIWDEDGRRSALETFSLQDLARTQSLSRSTSAWDGGADGGFLFLRTWGWTGAIDAYSLDDPAGPSFLASFEVDGAADPVEVVGERGYAAAGWRGVRVLDLSR